MVHEIHNGEESPCYLAEIGSDCFLSHYVQFLKKLRSHWKKCCLHSPTQESNKSPGDENHHMMCEFKSKGTKKILHVLMASFWVFRHQYGGPTPCGL